jgi:hypothetical protein
MRPAAIAKVRGRIDELATKTDYNGPRLKAKDFAVRPPLTAVKLPNVGQQQARRSGQAWLDVAQS